MRHKLTSKYYSGFFIDVIRLEFGKGLNSFYFLCKYHLSLYCYTEDCFKYFLLFSTYELITFDRDFVTFYENKAIISVYNIFFLFFL